MSYALVDQDGLMLGDERGPFLFPSLPVARQAAAHATLRIGGRFNYRVERYETHGRMRDRLDVPALSECATDVQSEPKNEGAPTKEARSAVRILRLHNDLQEG